MDNASRLLCASDWDESEIHISQIWLRVKCLDSNGVQSVLFLTILCLHISTLSITPYVLFYLHRSVVNDDHFKMIDSAVKYPSDNREYECLSCETGRHLLWINLPLLPIGSLFSAGSFGLQWNYVPKAFYAIMQQNRTAPSLLCSGVTYCIPFMTLRQFDEYRWQTIHSCLST